MKEKDAIELLKSMQSPIQDYADMVGAPAWAYGHQYVYANPEDYAIEKAITALEEKQNLKWIPVEEQLPERNERVLMYRPCMVGAETGPISVQWGWAYKDASHWMPLPGCPEN